MLGETTLPFNENDITHLVPLYIRTVAALGFFPTHLTADAAFDACMCMSWWRIEEALAPLPSTPSPLAVRLLALEKGATR